MGRWSGSQAASTPTLATTYRDDSTPRSPRSEGNSVVRGRAERTVPDRVYPACRGDTHTWNRERMLWSSTALYSVRLMYGTYVAYL
jgi:hypothetical protein